MGIGFWCLISSTNYSKSKTKTMLCISRIAESTCHMRFTYKFRKNCMAQSSLHHNSFDKSIQNYPIQRLSKSDQTKVIPKYVYNFYLPLGSKKSSFVNQENKLKKSTKRENNTCILDALHKSDLQKPVKGDKIVKEPLFIDFDKH